MFCVYTSFNLSIAGSIMNYSGLLSSFVSSTDKCGAEKRLSLMTAAAAAAAIC